VVELEYTLTLEDLVAFEEYHADHSPSIQRKRKFMRFFYPLVGIATGLYLVIIDGGLMIAIVFLIIIFLAMAIWFFSAPKRFRRHHRRAVTKLYQEGSNRALLGHQQQRADQNGLHSSSALGESRMNWSAIERMQSTPDYTFIYLSAVTAIVIPRKSVMRGDYEGFVQFVRREHERAHV
jgi:hypothetical protein